jgi:hypothetical protein
MAMSNEFKPWRADWIFGSILGVLATGFLMLAVSSLPIATTLGTFFKVSTALFALAAFFYLQRGFKRSHGSTVERKAIQQLQKRLRDGWGVTGNVAIQSGDLDALLEGPKEEDRYCIEIKSQRTIRIAVGGLMSRDRLVDHKGKAAGKDAIAQALRNAQQAVGHPVLWYPRAKTRSASKSVDDVIVVCGPVKDLLKALKVPAKGWF